MTEPLSPGQVPQREWLKEPLPVWLVKLLGTLVTAFALWLTYNWDKLHIYTKHYHATGPHLEMPWDALQAGMNEAAARNALRGAQLYCFDDRTGLGQRSCYTPAKTVDGYPALTVALFFRSGKLSVATVHVPWWAHGRATEALSARYGASRVARAGGTDDTLRRWDVDGGTVDMNRYRALSPLTWSAVVWTPKKRGLGESL